MQHELKIKQNEINNKKLIKKINIKKEPVPEK
jgi:hypothetical protein